MAAGQLDCAAGAHHQATLHYVSADVIKCTTARWLHALPIQSYKCAVDSLQPSNAVSQVVELPSVAVASMGITFRGWALR